MRKIFTTALILCTLLALNVSAQDKGFHTINAGVELGLPIGNFGNAYGIGFGATGKALYGITEQGDLTGTLGYIHFGMKNTGASMTGSMGMIPIMFGYRHDFGGIYGEPQLGLMIVKSKINFDGMGGGMAGFGGSASSSKVSVGLGGGYMFGDWDLGARFQIVDNLNFIGIRVGYNFAL